MKHVNKTTLILTDSDQCMLISGILSILFKTYLAILCRPSYPEKKNVKLT